MPKDDMTVLPLLAFDLKIKDSRPESNFEIPGTWVGRYTFGYIKKKLHEEWTPCCISRI